MTNFRARSIAAATGLILLGSATVALADPPGRVGRLSYVEGTVSFHTADQTDWSPATLNYPVTTGTSFWTEPNSRDEIQVGAAEVRMDQGTAFNVVRLDDQATQFQVDQGAVNIHVGVLPPGGISVMTAQGQIELLEPGSYNINAGAPAAAGAPPTQVLVTALEGSARFDGPHGAVDIQPGEAATIVADPFSANLAEGNTTPFDDWALGREHREQAAVAPAPAPAGQDAAAPVPDAAPAAAQAAAQYVPPDMTGYQDLNANGQWAPTPDYGPVWYPTTVPAGWAPYQFGHWAFVPPWGWTWIDDAPWGFAPFHYGRWAFIGGRWGWSPRIPGEFVGRPVYSPALVAFIGGGGFGVSLAVGGSLAAVGWVPLAPFEPYHPWYRTSQGYLRSVNAFSVRRNEIDHIRAVNNFTVDHFANRHAAVVVTASAFTHAAPVQRATVAVSAGQLAQVHVAANLSAFKATPEARAGFARPNAVGVEHAGVAASVAKGPVAYHEAPRPANAAATPHAPGPAFRPRANAALGQQRPAARPVGATPAQAVRPQAQPSAAAQAPVRPAPQVATQPRPAPQVATPPRPAPQAATPPRPAPQAVRPAPRPAGTTMQVQHPVQQTHLAPTPQGWKRQPAPHAAPRPEAPKAGEQDREKH